MAEGGHSVIDEVAAEMATQLCEEILGLDMERVADAWVPACLPEDVLAQLVRQDELTNRVQAWAPQRDEVAVVLDTEMVQQAIVNHIPAHAPTAMVDAGTVAEQCARLVNVHFESSEFAAQLGHGSIQVAMVIRHLSTLDRSMRTWWEMSAPGRHQRTLNAC